MPETQADVQVEPGEVESELFGATQPNVAVPRIGPMQKTHHARLMEVIARQNPNRSSSSITDRTVLCYCEVECNVVVSKSQTNAGQRFYGYNAYIAAQNRQGLQRCIFSWYDPPLTARGVQYALEMQAEVGRLERLNVAIKAEMLYG